MSERVDVFVLEIPLRVPWTTAMGTVTARRVALVRLGDDVVGWGEAPPFPGLDPDLDLEELRRGSMPPTFAAAIDQARADRDARIADLPLTSSEVAHIPISFAVGLDDPVGRVAMAVAGGVSRLKLKIAPGAVRHVMSVREAFPEVVIGVDANRSFTTPDELLALSDADVAYAEEPFEDWGRSAAVLAETTGIPLFSDESLRSLDDLEVLLASDAIAGITIKPGRLGWTKALQAREAAMAAGKYWRASGLLETGIGRAYADRLASLPGGFLSDVAPADAYLVEDVAPTRAGAGEIVVPTGAGLGVTPLPERLEEFTVARATIQIS